MSELYTSNLYFTLKVRYFYSFKLNIHDKLKIEVITSIQLSRILTNKQNQNLTKCPTGVLFTTILNNKAVYKDFPNFTSNSSKYSIFFNFGTLLFFTRNTSLAM